MGILSIGIQFIQQNAAYFEGHDIFRIPNKFISRISDLANMEIKSNYSQYVEIGQNRIEAAEKYIWIMSERLLFLLSTGTFLDALKKRVDEGVDVRLILPAHKTKFGNLSMKISQDPIHVGLMVSEKSAGFSFPLPDGVADQNTYLDGTDEVGIEWISDLFLHYWNQE